MAHATILLKGIGFNEHKTFESKNETRATTWNGHRHKMRKSKVEVFGEEQLNERGENN